MTMAAARACGNIGIDSAYQHSSNIYFSYLGTQLGGVKIQETAKLVGIWRLRQRERRRPGTP